MKDEQLCAVKAIATDMWAPYVGVAEELLPNADIGHDKFHIAIPQRSRGQGRKRTRKVLKGQDSGILAILFHCGKLSMCPHKYR